MDDQNEREKDPNDFDVQNMASNITDLLKRCYRATCYDAIFQEAIKNAILNEKNGTPQLLSGEKQLLNLATYSRCTDAILYVMPLIFNIEGRNLLYLRCFERGLCNNFLKSNWRIIFKELVEMHDIQDCFILHIFNDWDVMAAYNHRISKSKKAGQVEEKNSKIFKKLCTSNKESIKNLFPFAHAIMKKSFEERSPGFIVFCQRKAKFCRSDPWDKENSFLKVEGLGDQSSLPKMIRDYMTNREEQKETIFNIYDCFHDNEALTLEEESTILSAVPNFHHWATTHSSGVKMEQYFLNSGNSPRNIIVCALNEYLFESFDTLNLVKNTLALVLAKKYHMAKPPCQNKNQIRHHGIRKTIDRQLLLDQLGLTDDDFEQTNIPSENIYPKFKSHLYNNGTILWRDYTEHTQTIVMNDYNTDTG
eukprot:TCONS_00059785-protein